MLGVKSPRLSRSFLFTYSLRPWLVIGINLTRNKEAILEVDKAMEGGLKTGLALMKQVVH